MALPITQSSATILPFGFNIIGKGREDINGQYGQFIIGQLSDSPRMLKNWPARYSIQLGSDFVWVL